MKFKFNLKQWRFAEDRANRYGCIKKEDRVINNPGTVSCE